ncbi:alpha/beta fold hydrolase [Mycobacterium sp. pUA109]|uniref:alpha/beta fold hydrolase n=1 Tax=Mycobacterium sp. pUA109 TaxID=3238982 RepID=UPI00351AF57D
MAPGGNPIMFQPLSAGRMEKIRTRVTIQYADLEAATPMTSPVVDPATPSESTQPLSSDGFDQHTHRLVLDDIWLNVTEWGSSAPDVTVILSHGWTLSSRIWEDVAANIAKTDPRLRVITYDHRGHGASKRVSVATIEDLADDLAALIDVLAPEGPLVFGGHSMGGMTIMALAERQPNLFADRVGGVAFVASSAGDLLEAIRTHRGSEQLLRIGLALMRRIRRPSRPLAIARQSARSGFGARPHRHDLNRIVWQSAQSHPRAVAALGASILQHNRYQSLDALRHHGINVVAMAGTRDRLTPPVHARRIVDCIPGSQVIVYPDAGHFLPYERRTDVAAHLLDLTAKARTHASASTEVTT